MRSFILPLLLAALLLAPVALADDHGRGRGKSDAARELRDHDGDDADNDGRDARNKTSDRANATAMHEAWKANHSAFIDRVISHIQSLRGSWQENVTKVRAACSAFDHANATKEQRAEHRHCIRDGLDNWREVNRDNVRQLREEFRILMAAWGKGGHRSD